MVSICWEPQSLCNRRLWKSEAEQTSSNRNLKQEKLPKRKLTKKVRRLGFHCELVPYQNKASKEENPGVYVIEQKLFCTTLYALHKHVCTDEFNISSFFLKDFSKRRGSNDVAQHTFLYFIFNQFDFTDHC